MNMYKLIKLSSPSWEYTSHHLENILPMLESSICQSCKLTQSELRKEIEGDSEYQKYLSEIEDFMIRDSVIDTEVEMALSDNFNELSTKDKIEELLWTPCGAEYMLEGINEGDIQ